MLEIKRIKMIRINFKLLIFYFILISYLNSVYSQENIDEIKNLSIEKRNKETQDHEFKTKFIPIKYWAEKQEKIHINKNNTNDVINDDNDYHTSSFTKFYDQLNPNEKIIYNKILSSSNKDSPDLIIPVIIVDSDNLEDKIDTYNEKVFSALLFDHPELWWLGDYSLNILHSYNGLYYIYKIVYEIKSPSPNYTKDQIVLLNKRISIIKEDIKKKINTLGLTRPYAILKYIHDYLITKNIYSSKETNKNIKNVYGAMVENKCASEGYSEAFQILAKEYDIDVIIARNTIHEWNIAKIEDKWYIIDVTWDDPTIHDKNKPSGLNNNMKYSYFLIGKSNSGNIDNFDYNLIYSAYSVKNKLLKYPMIEENAYQPTNDDLNDTNKIDFNTSFSSTELVIANCERNPTTKAISCPNTLNYLCITGDNEIYTSDDNSTCSKKYSNNSKEYVVALKTSDGYKDYINDSVTDTSSFMIYNCGNDSISSGCIVYTDDHYIDSANKHIYYLDTDKQYKQVIDRVYYDDDNNKNYLCNSNGICSELIYQNNNLDDSMTSDEIYNDLINNPTRNTNNLTPSVDGYYINPDDNGKSLVICKNTNSEASCSEIVTSPNIKTTGYAYLDAGNSESTSTSYAGIIICTSSVCSSKPKPTNDDTLYYIDGAVSDDKNIIQCDKTECKSFVGNPKKAYAIIDSSKDGNVLLGNDNKFIPTSSGATSSSSKYYIDAIDTKQIITCGYNTTSGKVICTRGPSGADGNNNSYFIDAGISGNIIKCTSTECTSSLGSLGYYMSNNSNYPLIKCTGHSNDIKCENVDKKNIKTAYYLDASSIIDSSSYGKIIYCSNIGTTSCSNVNSNYKGFYIEGSTPGKLINSNGSQYSLLGTTSIGYYLDGSSTTDNINYNKVIKCTSETKCTSIETTYEGYYLDGSSISMIVASKKREEESRTWMSNSR